jgi:hypothetical protein
MYNLFIFFIGFINLFLYIMYIYIYMYVCIVNKYKNGFNVEL